jgi:hypothetical protein
MIMVEMIMATMMEVTTMANMIMMATMMIRISFSSL